MSSALIQLHLILSVLSILENSNVSETNAGSVWQFHILDLSGSFRLKTIKRPLLSKASVRPTPARRACRTPCIHAGVTESWLGRSRLLPNCAIQSCCALGVGGWLLQGCMRSVWRPKQWTRHWRNPTLAGSRCSAEAKGHRSYASVCLVL